MEAEFGKRMRVFCDSTPHHGGTRAEGAHSGGGKDITCVMVISASGRVCPSFFIVQVSHVMSGWFTPMVNGFSPGTYAPYSATLKRYKYIGKETNVVCTPCGSKDMNVFLRFIDHLNRFVWLFVVAEQH